MVTHSLSMAVYGLLASALLAVSAQAGDHGDWHRGPMYEQIKSMSDAEREAFFTERKAKWDAMSKEEKLAEIEKRRAERIKWMEDKWGSMSDDEKIKHVERKMEHMRKGGCMKGMRGSKNKESAPAGVHSHEHKAE